MVIIAGSPPGIPGSTNALRIHRMGDAINEVAPATGVPTRTLSRAGQVELGGVPRVRFELTLDGV